MTHMIDLVIFGGTGDLAQRKLLPSLWHLHRANQLDRVRRIISLGRSGHDTPAYRVQIADQINDAAESDSFLGKLEYLTLDATQLSDFDALSHLLHNPAPAEQTVFYLATAPALYGTICEHLKSSGVLALPSRVVLEKPIGNDLASCREINQRVLAVFNESNVFRIDHYLGKETVQNLLALRFGNSMFDPVWNSHHVDNIQITVAESIGVEGRGDFYAQTGALRDMVQNHILQVLCLVAMEPPASLEADTIRDEKLKVLRALTPITADTVKKNSVRGQYDDGAIDGQPVRGFLEEGGFAQATNTETFVALRAGVHNWRWINVPIYLRTGKRLAGRYSEIVVEFKKHPFSLFADDQNHTPNKLVINIQPEESITLHTVIKKPGLSRGIKLEPVELTLTADTDKKQHYDAYERLLLDVFAGDQTLFMRGDEVEAAWQWIDGIIQAWHDVGVNVKPYPAGTMGPAAAQALTERDGRSWYD